MRIFAVLVVSAALHFSWVLPSHAQSADLPGDRADALAQSLMSPF